MAGTALPQTWDLRACVADLRAVQAARREAVRAMGLTLASIVAELRGSYVGAHRQRALADMLEQIQGHMEELA